jgi:hypothetical protein
MSAVTSSVMFLSTKAIVFPTFARLGSVPVMLAFEALGQGAVLNKKLTVFELPIMQQAFLH